MDFRIQCDRFGSVVVASDIANSPMNNNNTIKINFINLNTQKIRFVIN